MATYTDKTPRRASLNRYSWSSASSTNSTPSPTSPNNGTAPTRKFRLPVRVSTDLTSFASSDSSPQSRRRSLSLASDSKRRSSQIPALKKVEESNNKGSTEKSSPKSPETSTSKPKGQPSPPPAYKDTKEPVSDPKDTKSPPPTYQDVKPKETTPPKPVEQPPPAVQKPVAPSPATAQQNPASRPATTTVPPKMSSAASSPDAQKAAIANPMGNSNPMANANRGLDFSVGNANTKLTHQSEHGGSLPLPNLSGRPNGPVGNLLRGAVDEEGRLKDAALMVGIKMDLEAEVHLSARVRGDILVGLY
ncbi:hypothetical protein N0V82_006905 [Gnomoniopsis sp. IMI 355080]|nr:hypothetical protein N0V82_006905 [Gnomoniopsis sp. IMI 355080]